MLLTAINNSAALTSWLLRLSLRAAGYFVRMRRAEGQRRCGARNREVSPRWHAVQRLSGMLAFKSYRGKHLQSKLPFGVHVPLCVCVCVAGTDVLTVGGVYCTHLSTRDHNAVHLSKQWGSSCTEKQTMNVKLIVPEIYWKDWLHVLKSQSINSKILKGQSDANILEDTSDKREIQSQKKK